MGLLKNRRDFVYRPKPADTDYFKSAKWQKLRDACLARDAHRRQRCKKQHKAGELGAHFRVPRSLGGEAVLDNLTTLCCDCHDIVELEVAGEDAPRRRQPDEPSATARAYIETYGDTSADLIRPPAAAEPRQKFSKGDRAFTPQMLEAPKEETEKSWSQLAETIGAITGTSISKAYLINMAVGRKEIPREVARACLILAGALDDVGNEQAKVQAARVWTPHDFGDRAVYIGKEPIKCANPTCEWWFISGSNFQRYHNSECRDAFHEAVRQAHQAQAGSPAQLAAA